MRTSTLVAVASAMFVACSPRPDAISVLTIAEPQLTRDLVAKLGSGPLTGVMVGLGEPASTRSLSVSLDSTSVALVANVVSVPPALVVLGDGIERSQGLAVSNVSLLGGDIRLGNSTFSAGGLLEGSDVRVASRSEVAPLAGFSGIRPPYFVLMKSTDDSVQRGAIAFQSTGQVQVVLVFRAARGDLTGLRLLGRRVGLSAGR